MVEVEGALEGVKL